jgi:hypothetical protein
MTGARVCQGVGCLHSTSAGLDNEDAKVLVGDLGGFGHWCDE